MSNSLTEELLARLREHWMPLADKPDETPDQTLALLTAKATSDAQLLQWIDQRIAGVPLAHLTGRQIFLNIEFLSSPEALIPRKETEILALGALGVLHNLVQERGGAEVIDVCCGTGNVALALAFFERGSKVRGSDLSAEAVSLANRNVAHLGLQDRAEFVTGDLFSPFKAPVDLITCNPPYISTPKVEKMPHEISSFEPRLAFDGGPFGVSILMRLIREAPQFLKPESWLAFEVGLGQGKAMAKIVGNSPAFQNCETLTDAAGEIRAVLAQTHAAQLP